MGQALKLIGMNGQGQLCIANADDYLNDPNIVDLLGRTTTLEGEYTAIRALAASKSARLSYVNATPTATMGVTVAGISVVSAAYGVQLQNQVNQIQTTVNGLIDVDIAQNLMSP